MNDSRALPPIPRIPPTITAVVPPRPPPLLPSPSTDSGRRGGRLSRRGIHDHPERFHRIRACLAFLSFLFPPFFSRSPFRGGRRGKGRRKGIRLQIDEDSALALVSLRSLLSAFFFSFFFFYIRTFADEFKGGSRATESIEFRPAPEVTRQTNGKPDRLVDWLAGWLAALAVLNRVYRITARFIYVDPGGVSVLCPPKGEKKTALRVFFQTADAYSPSSML